MKKGTIRGFILGVLVTVLLMASFTAIASTGAKTIEILYNNIKIALDGVQVTPRDVQGNIVEPFIYQGTTYLPLRAVANALGLAVDWDNESKTVVLGTGGLSGDLSKDNPASMEALTMATNAEFPPYEFYKGGKIVGIDIEIAEAIAKKIGMKLSIEDIDFDSVVQSIETGKYNMAMAGLIVTDASKERVNFSTSYATGVQVIIVPEGSSITSVEDLFADGAAHRVGVQLSTTGDLYSTWDLEDEGLAAIERYPKGADAVMALIAGKIDCVIIDNEPAKVFVSQNTGLKILDTVFAKDDYAIAVNKNNPELLAKINSALNELIADGTVQRIIDKYIQVN